MMYQREHGLILAVHIALLCLLTCRPMLCAQVAQNTPVGVTAYKVGGAISDADFRSLLKDLNSNPSVTYVDNDVMSRYHILVAQRPLSPEATSFIDKRAKVLNLDVTITKLPVLDDKGKISIPTGKLIVRFQGSVTEAEAHQRLENFHLNITALRKGPSGIAYFTVDRDGDIERLTLSAKELQRAPDVIYADLDSLQLIGSVPQSTPSGK